MLGWLISDTRVAARSLRKSPAATAAIVLTLALGIGANTAIYSAAEAVLLRPLDMPGADRVVAVLRKAEGRSLTTSPTPETYSALRADARSFEQIEMIATRDVVRTDAEGSALVEVAYISETFPAFMGVRPHLGRGFDAAETRDPAARVVMLDYGHWRSAYGGRPDVLGERITLDAETYTIVGVMARGASLPRMRPAAPMLWAPLVVTPETRGADVVGKLRAGVTLESAQEEARAIGAAVAAADGLSGTWTTELQPAKEFTGGGLRDAIVLLIGVVALLLLIAAINTSNVMTSRALAREREFLVRSVLGASRARLAVQMLVESLLLAGAGALLGLIAAAWFVDGIRLLRPESMSAIDRMTVDGRVLAFAISISLVTGVLAGLLPALRAAAERGADTLRSGARAAHTSARVRRLRLGLVALQVACSFAILVGATLLVRSVDRLMATDIGFRSEGLLALSVMLPTWAFPDEEVWALTYEQLEEAIAGIDGVTATSTAGGVPPSMGVFFGEVGVNGERAPDAHQSLFFGTGVDTDYFRVLGQPLLAGRMFQPGEENAYIIGESAARRLFPEGAVGQRLSVGGEPREVVGVVGDAAVVGLGETEERMQLYTPAAAAESRMLLVRTDESVDAIVMLDRIRERIRTVNKNVVVSEATTVSSMMAASVARQRFLRVLLIAFGAVAIMISSLGLYGVLAHSTSLRVREFGIRMCLGADGRSILAGVLRQGAGAILLGLVGGIVLAMFATKLAASQLFGIERNDPFAFAAAGSLLMLVGLIAAWLPARRAAATEPLVALRSE